MVSWRRNLPRIWIGLAAVLVSTSSAGMAGATTTNDRAICSARVSSGALQQIPDTVLLKILLVEFQDVRCRKGLDRTTPRYSKKDFEDMLGSEGIYVSPSTHSPDGDPVFGSMNDYFQAMSGGAVRIRAEVINPANVNTGFPEWVRLSEVKEYYERDGSKDSVFVGAERAASALGLDVTTSAVTKLAIIYAGNTFYTGGGLNPVAWENRYIMSELQGKPYGQENADARFSRIGIHCHEFAHTIGIGHSSGSRADLMCSGTNNGSVEGNVPAPLNPIARMKIGWLNVRSTDSLPDGEVELGYSLRRPICFRMKNSNGDYFLIEDRRFDQTMVIGKTVVPDYNNAAFFPPAQPHGAITQGILVWRINAVGDVNDPGYSTEGLLYASGRYGRTYPGNTPSETDDGVPFPGVSNRRILSPWSDPRNPYTKESDYFGSGLLHYTLFVPNTKGESSWQMEILSEDRNHGTFRVKFSTPDPSSPVFETAEDPDSLGLYREARTVMYDSAGVVHQVVEIGGEVFYRHRGVGTTGWQGVRMLSNGNGGNGGPSIIGAGAAILAVWQVQASGAGNYVIHARRSTDAGSTWSDLFSVGSARGCDDFGPRPSVAGDRDGRTIVVYCTLNSVFSAISGDAGKNWGKPSGPILFHRILDGSSIVIIKDANSTAHADLVVLGEGVSGDRGVYHSAYDFSTGVWSEPENVSSVMPARYIDYARPCVLQPRVESGNKAYLAWDATDSGDIRENVVVYRSVSSSGVETSYRILNGRSLNTLRWDEFKNLAAGVEGKNSPTETTETFVLEQNYPNPFNPKTGVRFQVPPARQRSGGGVRESGIGGRGLGAWVKLAVYDLLGREVAVLANERKAPGSYEVTFDGAGLSSGVYFYRMEAGTFVQTKRMLLIR